MEFFEAMKILGAWETIVTFAPVVVFAVIGYTLAWLS